MDEKDLLKVLKEGEGQEVEFKRSFAEIDRAIHVLVSFGAPGMGDNLAVKVRYGLGSGNH